MKGGSIMKFHMFVWLRSKNTVEGMRTKEHRMIDGSKLILILTTMDLTTENCQVDNFDYGKT